MTPATFMCGFFAGSLFLAKEYSALGQAGGFNIAFLKSTGFNLATTGLTLAGGALLAKGASIGVGATLASRWGGALFYRGLPSVICGLFGWCASPHWPPG
jgi:hypothetical protein